MKYTPIVKVMLVRDRTAKTKERPMADNPKSVAAIALQVIGDSDREHLLAIFTDAHGATIAINTVSIGTLTASLVHPREVFKAAILAQAAGIVLVHNHPSGRAEPSDDDKETTRRLRKAGELMGIPVVDHVILGHDGEYWSMREHGQCDFCHKNRP